jgi:F-type H+-transporting ATPase subunit delta
LTQNTHHFSDAAGRYALSLFEISREENALEDIEKNIKFLDEALIKSEDFKKFVKNPTLSKVDRLSVIVELGKKNNFNIFLINFLKILIEKQRIFFLEKIIKCFKDILCDFRDELNAVVTMPTNISDSQIREIETMLNNILKKQVNLNFKHDPSLISGAKLQIGSLMVEDTAKAKFNKILNNL